MSFKSSMANYYHEARAQARKLKDIQEANKQKREQRAELPAEPDEHPVNHLEVHGRTARLHRNADQAAAVERGDGLIPWNGDAQSMIDRFDGRALLDMYREPPAHALKGRTKTADELKLEELHAFEAYRDLVRLTSSGCSEAEGLKRVAEESLELRAAPKIAAAAALAAATAAKCGFPGFGGAAAAAPAGAGMYSNLGFSYGGSGGAEGTAVDSSSSSSDDDSDDDSDSDDADAAPANAEEAAQEAEDERLDTLAEAFGITDFSYRLFRTLEREGEEEARRRKRPKKNMGRKKAALRARRMAGRGLNPAGEVLRKGPSLDPRTLINPWADEQEQLASGSGRLAEDRVVYQRRDSPEYDGEARGTRRRSRSGSPGRVGPARTEFITEFTSDGGARGGESMFGDTFGQGIIIEALPDRPDPAMLGGFQPLTKEAFAVQGVKPEEARERDRERQRQREKEREEERQREREAERRARDKSREREGDRDRSKRGRDRRSSRHSRSRSKSRGRDRGHDRQYRRSRSRSKDRGRGRDRSRSKDRGRGRDRSRSTDRSRGHSGSREHGRNGRGHGNSRDAGDKSQRRSTEGGGLGSKHQPPVATTPRGSTAAQPPVPKETHAERLKRIMQAQLNKQQQKDHVVTTQKKIQAEKEKAARAHLERVLPPLLKRSPSPNRSRSPSPGRQRRR